MDKQALDAMGSMRGKSGAITFIWSQCPERGRVALRAFGGWGTRALSASHCPGLHVQFWVQAAVVVNHRVGHASHQVVDPPDFLTKVGDFLLGLVDLRSDRWISWLPPSV